jgi:hypothetical protein
VHNIVAWCCNCTSAQSKHDKSSRAIHTPANSPPPGALQLSRVCCTSCSTLQHTERYAAITTMSGTLLLWYPVLYNFRHTASLAHLQPSHSCQLPHLPQLRGNIRTWCETTQVAGNSPLFRGKGYYTQL